MMIVGDDAHIVPAGLYNGAMGWDGTQAVPYGGNEEFTVGGDLCVAPKSPH